jgi:hypothetical protein
MAKQSSEHTLISVSEFPHHLVNLDPLSAVSGKINVGQHSAELFREVDMFRAVELESQSAKKSQM